MMYGHHAIVEALKYGVRNEKAKNKKKTKGEKKKKGV